MLGMKQVIKRLLITVSLIVSSCTLAEEMIELVPYLGVDFYEAWMKPKGFYKQIFPSSYPGASLYVGTKVSRHFGFELGYDWSTKRDQTWRLANNQAFFKYPVAGTVSGKTKIRRSGGHLDIMAFLPVYECLDLIASIGYGWVQSKIEISRLSIPPNSVVPNSSAIASMASKGHGVFRANVGASYMITELLGARAKLGWESTSMLRVRGNGYFTQLGYQTRPFKASITFSTGLFYKF